MPISRTPIFAEQTWSQIARLCRFIGIVGAVGLTLLIGFSLYASHEAHHSTGCLRDVPANVTVSTSDPDGVRIIGLLPSHVELNHYLCVNVDNVVSATKQDELLANVSVAAKEVADSATVAKSTTPKGGAAAQAPTVQADAKLADATQTKAKADLASAKGAFDDALKPRTMVLYLNGKASPLTATARAIPGPQTLMFEVTAPDDANSADAAYWRALLAEPASDGRIPLRVGVAEQGSPAPMVNLSQINGRASPEAITFLLYTPMFMRLATGAMVAIMLGLFGLAYDSTLLRSGTDRRSAYSLSLVQMAIWLVLTTTGFVYIWLVTGQYQNVFTSGLFTLIGISGATATAIQLIDRDQEKPASNGFLYDIVGAWRGGEVQLQRLQIIAWTIILALIFFWNVLAKLTLTTFDANLLVLTGIANGVYVSMKPQEAKEVTGGGGGTAPARPAVPAQPARPRRRPKSKP